MLPGDAGESFSEEVAFNLRSIGAQWTDTGQKGVLERGTDMHKGKMSGERWCISEQVVVCVSGMKRQGGEEE